jgi:hypothetical protein
MPNALVDGGRAALPVERKHYGSDKSSHTQFVLNVAPVVFDEKAETQVGLIPYENHEQLRSLQESHRSTHVIRRHKLSTLDDEHDTTNQIVAIPLVENAPQVGVTYRKLMLREHLGHVAALIRESLISFLVGFPRRVLDYRPITFLAEATGDNVLHKSLPKGITCPPWLGVNPLFELDVRVLEIVRDRPFVGICINLFTRRRIEATCQQMLDDGFPIIGQYVKRLLDSHDPRIQRHLQLVGKAASVDGGMIRLVDHRDDFTEISASAAYLETAAFDDVLRHVFTTNYGAIRSRLDSSLQRFNDGVEKLSRLERLRTYIEGRPLSFLPGLTWIIGRFLAEADGTLPPMRPAPPVTYVFDSTGHKTDTWHVRGIDKHGPYSTPTFSPTEPRICVICQKPHRGRVEQFVRKFLHGIGHNHSNSTGSGQPVRRQPFEKGFVRKYALQDAKTKFFEVEDRTADAYRTSIHLALQSMNGRHFRFDLALVEIEESFHLLKGASDPYLVTKAEFLSHQIPVQEFEFETTEIPDKRLHYVLNNMGLATYAKLGGTPWLVRANLPIAHELVIGLGSASVGEGRLGERERVVGITTVFSGDGNYCVSTVSKAVAFSDYEVELLASLRQTITRVSKSMNWQPKDHVRLVFHAFKPFKNVEADAVKNLVQGLGDYQVEYAFLHVVETHPFMLFDKKQEGVWAYDGTGKKKGNFAPERGHFLRLSGNEALIVLTGPKELKQASDGMPKPVALKLGRGSTFRDVTYLTQQVNTFACHSWRGFDNSPLPVTLMYSELIARLLGKLGAVPFWNPSQMYGKIGETRWFL